VELTGTGWLRGDDGSWWMPLDALEALVAADTDTFGVRDFVAEGWTPALELATVEHLGVTYARVSDCDTAWADLIQERTGWCRDAIEDWVDAAWQWKQGGPARPHTPYNDSMGVLPHRPLAG